MPLSDVKQAKLVARALTHFNRNMDRLPDKESRTQLFDRMLKSHQKRIGILVHPEINLTGMEDRLRVELKAEYAALRRQVTLHNKRKRAKQRLQERAQQRVEREAAAAKRKEEKELASSAASVARAKKKLNKNKALVHLAVQHGNYVFPGLSDMKAAFMKDEYERIQRELIARQEATLPAMEQFRYLQQLLVKHGYEYGYNVKIEHGAVLWLSKQTRRLAYVFGLSPGYTFSASKRLWAMGKHVFRVAIFYNETNAVAYGKFVKWLLEKQAKMSVFNLTLQPAWQTQMS